MRRLLRRRVPGQHQRTAHVRQRAERHDEGAGVRLRGAGPVTAVDALEGAVPRVREHVPAPLREVTDRQRARLRYRQDRAGVGLAATLDRHRDLGALRRPQDAGGRGVGHGLGVGHRAGVERQDPVGVVDRADLTAGRLQHARVVKERETTRGEGQTPRQAAARQLEVDGGRPGVGRGVGHRGRPGHRQARGGIGDGKGDRRLGLRARHQLGVETTRLDREVAELGRRRQRHDADVGAGVGDHGIAHLGARPRAGEAAAGRRTGEVGAQGIADVDGDDVGGVIDVGRVGEHALHRRDGRRPHVLQRLVAEPLVLHQHQRLPDVRQHVRDALKELDHALAGDVVLVEVTGPLRAFVEVGLDAGRGLRARIEGGRGAEQRHADAGIGRRIGDDDVAAEVGVGVVGLHRDEGLA